jgi:Predicted nucleotide-binding protein containing TIR-like domain
MTHELPALFIGSSVEGLNAAYGIQQVLEYDAECTVWSQGIFRPSQAVLYELVKCLPKFEFAVFVFSPDDTVKLRGLEFSAVRDNVIFELGLFMGALGPERCFYLVPRNAVALHLPSDLAGITPLSYNAARTDSNLVAALGPACNEIRNAMKRAEKSSVVRATIHQPGNSSGDLSRYESSSDKLQRYVESWNGELLTKARELVHRKGIPMSAYEVDDDTQPEWDAFNKMFYFLESVSASVMSGEIDSDAARKAFGTVLPSVWLQGSTALAMPNHVEDSWQPLPNIAQVSALWQGP